MILNVKCVEAKEVPKMDFIGESDPYLVLKLSSSNQEWKTKVINNTKNPIWNQSFQLPVTSSMGDVLTVTMYDKDPFNSDIISHCVIQINRLEIGKVYDDWLEMTSDCKYSNAGTVRLMLHLTRHGAEPFKSES